MAKQYRVFDGQAMLVDAVLGGAFGGAHHLAARNADAPPPADNEAPIPRQRCRVLKKQLQNHQRLQNPHQ